MLLSTPSLACSLVPVDPQAVKEVMASKIAQKLGWTLERIPRTAITTPVLQMPLGLGADCSGLGAFHHTAGFSLVYENCKVEGVAVLLGFDLSEPVAVHYQDSCR